VTRTLQNTGLLLGVLKLRRRLQPVRTMALFYSRLPPTLQRIFNLRARNRVLTAIGLGDFSVARRLMAERTWPTDDLSIFDGALALALGHLRMAASDKASRGGLLNKISAAAKEERDFLLDVAANPKDQVLAGVSVQRPAKNSVRDGCVLHVLGTSLPFDAAGYNMRTQQLLSAIAHEGVKTAAATRLLYPVDRMAVKARDRDQVGAVEYLRLLPKRVPRTRDDFQKAWGQELANVAQSKGARLLHATTDFPNGVAALSAAQLLDLPVVYEVRGFLEESAQVRIEQSEPPDSKPDINGANERYELTRAAETSVMQEVNAVTTLSLSMKDEIRARGIPEAKIHVMPNAVPAEWLDIKTDHEGVRSSLGLAPDEFLVGLFTTFSAHEGVPTLLNAMVNLKNLKVRVKCLLIGDGPTLESAKSLTEKYGLSNDVIFLGRLPQLELPRYYQALDLFVLPRVDARVTQLVTPLKPLEAMALGTPVVGSSVGGIKEIVEHAVTGELFKPEDAVDCAQVIQSLLYDSARRERLAEAAREWVAANRTWTGIAKRYVKLYQELGAI